MAISSFFLSFLLCPFLHCIFPKKYKCHFTVYKITNTNRIRAQTYLSSLQVTFRCEATNAPILKIVHLKQVDYEALRQGLDTVDEHKIQRLTKLRQGNHYLGIIGAESKEEVVQDQLVQSMSVQFRKAQMSNLFDNGYTVACIAHNDFIFRGKLLTDDYLIEGQ
jgi:hypothetical protein